MNKELILKVADEIEAMPHSNLQAKRVRSGFNMSDWFERYPCGTVCCIGGHLTRRMSVDLDGVADRLGITRYQADTLCFAVGRKPGTALSQIKPSQAAAVLRHLAETGNVDWSVVSES